MGTYWGGGLWAARGWGGGGINNISFTAKKGMLSIRRGGILGLTAKRGTLSIIGSGGDNLNVFNVSAKRSTLTISGLHGVLGNFDVSAKKGTMTLAGYSSTSGDFDAVAKRGLIYFDPISATWNCVALCLENAANSDYDNFEFDSFAAYAGYILAANSDGIYVLTGADDDGTNIDVTVETAQDDFGVGELKSVPDIFITYNGGDITVSAVNESTVRTGYDLEATTRMRTKRARVGEGVEELFWGTRVENNDGNSTDIDKIEMRPYKRSGRA
jgi:hypothetical protein